MLPTCRVHCAIFDNDGTPIQDATVTAALNRFEVYQGYVVPDIETATTDATGACVLALWPNALGATASSYAVKIVAPNGRTQRLTVTVPDVADANLHEIANLPPYEGKPDGQLIIDAAVAAVAPAVAAKIAAEAARDSASGHRLNAQLAQEAAQAAEAAAESARDAAQISAGQSAASAADSLRSSTAAAGSATSAATSAATANARATAAEDAATTAVGAAQTATTKASEASDSATAALAAQGAAQTAAGLADQHQIAAESAATTATAAAQTATAKAGEAATSATASSASAAAAQAAANGAADAVVSQLSAIKTQTEYARDQALDGLGAADNSQILSELVGALAYATDMALKGIDGITENRGTVGSTDRAELYALMFGELLDKIGVIGRAISGGDLIVRAGTTLPPPVSPVGDRDTGLLFPAADVIALLTAGLERLRIDASGRVGIGTNAPSGLLDVADDKIRIRAPRTPASATASGTQGEIAWDANYLYVCTATNTWRRAALSTW